METLTLTRKEMACLLYSLSRSSHISPLSIVQNSWLIRHQREIEQGESMNAFISTSLSPIMERLIKTGVNPAFSLQDIVSLGVHIEYAQFSLTSVQNWVKRDFKSFIGQPSEGKRYSLQQIALFFVIEDLRCTLDYESIRKYFGIIFKEHSVGAAGMIEPLEFYAIYASLYEELDVRFKTVPGEQGDPIARWDKLIDQITYENAAMHSNLTEQQQKALQSALHVAILSVHASSFHSLARRYVNGMLFLHQLH
ncbi:DUF1836 domain-containing protein [Paenibacillus sp. GCM10012307]|uniref:DUF1836 domain-containing protein n=1 Tax=Paenibacillus roseus TaxID=2798579 RepID=A0A934J4N2_9BACL|nr:DUF1836 domain-containing protein [Paenibacillus roseus]MBJ6361594.1 DUF1836 domain-containing protein [Paenibacillus roseus]